MFLLGALGSLSVGLFWAGQAVFDMQHTAVAFLLNGLGCAFVFALQRWRNLWAALGMSVVLAVVLAVIAEDLFLTVLVYSVYMMLATASVSEFMWRSIFTNLWFGKFVYLGIVLAAASLLSTLTLVVVLDSPLQSELLLRQSVQGLMIGFGLGLGFEAAEWLVRKRYLLSDHGKHAHGAVS